jgi:hypothetical protein
MVSPIKKKRVRKTKNLSSKKLTPLPLHSKIFQAPLLKRGVRPLPNVLPKVPRTPQASWRKVKNQVVTKRRGLLYNTD